MLNKQKGNMYNFVTHTWNLIKGICPHNCSYCYMRRWWPKMKAPRLDEKEFKVNPGTGKTIFIGSSIDMNAYPIPGDWRREIVEYISQFDNTCLFQSKNPGMFFKSIYPDNTILCTTIETNRHYKKIMGDCPEPLNRCDYFRHNILTYRKMITIEPVMDFDLNIMIKWMQDINPMQINIGADSGGNNLPEPSPEKLKEFIRQLGINGLNVHKKVNLKRLLEDGVNK